MNTGLLRYAVGTVLTVYGIETNNIVYMFDDIYLLEQCLPFTVLKLVTLSVVLVLSELEQCLPFTVLKRIKHRH